MFKRSEGPPLATGKSSYLVGNGGVVKYFVVPVVQSTRNGVSKPLMAPAPGTRPVAPGRCPSVSGPSGCVRTAAGAPPRRGGARGGSFGAPLGRSKRGRGPLPTASCGPAAPVVGGGGWWWHHYFCFFLITPEPRCITPPGFSLSRFGFSPRRDGTRPGREIHRVRE